MTLVHANEATAAQRRVYFQLVDAVDGITAETGEAAGQPQISTNGGAWTNTGIGTLTAIGNGRYYADLTQTAVATAGDIIETRYKSANTAECPGDSVQVVIFNITDSAALGLDFTSVTVGTVTNVTNAVLITSSFPANTAFNGFGFVMVDINNAPVTGATVTAQRSIDGAAFSNCANAVSEIGSGGYKINLAASDMNGQCILLKFSAGGCVTRFIEILTTPTA